MAIQLRCANPDCGVTLQVPDTTAGKRVRCPRCGEVQPATPAARPTAVTPALPEKASCPEWVLEAVPAANDAYTAERPTACPGLEPEERPPRELLCPDCGGHVTPDDLDCPACGRTLDPATLRAEADGLRWRCTLYQGLAFVFAAPGLVISLTAGIILQAASSPLDQALRGLVALAGFALVWLAVGFAVAYRRDNLAWAFVGVLGFVGLVVVACLPDQKGRRLRRLRALLEEADRTDRRGELPAEDPYR